MVYFQSIPRKKAVKTLTDSNIKMLDSFEWALYNQVPNFWEKARIIPRADAWYGTKNDRNRFNQGVDDP